MKKVTKITIVALMIAMAFNSCNKYEDGPLISFRSPMNRLLGKWEVEGVIINGDDITTLYNDSCGCKFSFHSEKHTPEYFTLLSCVDNFSYYGSFHFNSNENIDLFTSTKCNSDSCIYYDTIPIFGPLKVMITTNWDVRRLTNKNLWIANNYNGNIYMIKLKKYEKDN